ncbi:MAG: GNAT family N-acetyltransferase [Firmicutes bacterium]|nr:GNAT family N-acetyltransferase [Bacillota bacterium]
MIRKAISDDIEKINKLGLQLHPNFKHTYNVEHYLTNENYIIVVSEDSKTKINAFMIIYKNIDNFELEAIVVDMASRKKGIANNLMNYFINSYAKKNDIILLEVAVNNSIAIDLYKKFDFEIINIRKKYYNNIDAYVMKKVI